MKPEDPGKEVVLKVEDTEFLYTLEQPPGEPPVLSIEHLAPAQPLEGQQMIEIIRHGKKCLTVPLAHLEALVDKLRERRQAN